MSETAPIRADERFDAERVAQYLRANGVPVGNGPVEVTQFTSGHSNLTYLLQIGGWEGVLRRPPLGPIPPKAHDMARESRILSLIQPVFPLAPRPYLFCADPAVIGCPFYVMERRHGLVLDQKWPEGLEPNLHVRERISAAVVDTLVDLHAVDVQANGLTEIGKPEGYMERQVQGWIGRWERAKTAEIAAIPALERWLTEQVPAPSEGTLVHNDFKLNNVMLDPHDPGRVTAVLDWEMATVGDPLSDLAGLLAYWNEPGDEQTVGGLLSVTSLPGFLSRRDLLQRYAAQSGRDVSAMGFYLAFAYFKVAVICQQIYYRWHNGQTQDQRFRLLGQVAGNLVQHSYDTAMGAGL